MTTYRLAGVDLAWQPERNPSAVALGALHGQRLSVDAVTGSLVSLDEVMSAIDREGQPHGVAVDAALIIRNQAGQRPCERDLNKDYRSRSAGCHPSNLTLYPDAASVKLGESLSARGLKHYGEPAGPWQIECYPHPAIIELFSLPERLRYKKGSVKEKRGGQIRLAELIQERASDTGLSVVFSESVAPIFDPQLIAALRGKALKANEDQLDAIVCLLIAAHYQAGSAVEAYGDTASGYIVVPTPFA